MSLRHAHAVAAASEPTSRSLPALTQQLADAVNEVTASGGDPAVDPAVRILGSFVAFYLNADTIHINGYRELINACHQEVQPVSGLHH